MDFSQTFSQASNRTKPSIIRALLKLVQQSDIISFAGGTPDAELFPRDLLADIASRVIREQGKLSLQYGETVGWRPLREAVAEYLSAQGIACTQENILITTGSQQGLYLAGLTLLNPGDGVVVEEPSYLGGLLSFQNFLAEFLPVACGPEGVNPDEVDQRIAQAPRKPKLVYTIPTFQNPGGSTMPEKQRAELVEVARRHNLLVIEDNPYGELNFTGKTIKPLKSFDKDGRVIYLGSFSKIASPGMRLGWVCADPALVARMATAKETVDVCTDVLSQSIAAEFLKGGHLHTHLQKLIGTYQRRRDTMLAAIEEYFPKEVWFNRPLGGFFVWAGLPEGFNTVELFEKAVAAKVAYVVGTAFYTGEKRGLNTLRLTYCAVDEAKIKEGIKRLGGVFQEALSQRR
ncbi:MAG TPA: PLP-dependent aminotransferase family protein [bacterium]|jgi:2-aminoadipate transaminase|nr:PLP-dependent aminotransferase family protein [bacterium]